MKSRYEHLETKPDIHDHAFFKFDDGTFVIYNDQRRFGFIDLSLTKKSKLEIKKPDKKTKKSEAKVQKISKAKGDRLIVVAQEKSFILLRIYWLRTGIN